MKTKKYFLGIAHFMGQDTGLHFFNKKRKFNSHLVPLKGDNSL